MPNQVFQSYEEKVTGPRQVTIRGHAEGANGANMTVLEGESGVVSIAWVSEGIYTVTFRRTFAKLISWSVNNFAADTAADVKGHTCVVDYNATSLTAPRATVSIAITNASETLDDLLDNEYWSFSFTFSESGLAS